ncbi:MAG: alpha/beta hydrolase [Dehalococcoidia bacterium]|nr:alpha/beta hydrolase [Dehalococcoidia bacterium]
MTTTAELTHTRHTRELAGIQTALVTGGQGDPLLVLHDETGHPGWMRWHENLSQDFNLQIPMMPGYGGSENLDWAMSMRDMAGWYLEALDDMDIGQVSVVGFSLGGWLAAELATMNPERFKKLALVSAAGVRPPVGEILDIFLITVPIFLEASVADKGSVAEFPIICPDEPTHEQAMDWEDVREVACMLGWRPYMHNPNLPHLLHRLKRLPTLIVWGRDDAIIPLSAGQLYNESIPGSRLAVLDNCGHRPEIEHPDEFARILSGFLKED